MKSCGTTKDALIKTGNYQPGESLEKFHTHLNPTPDGKLWLGTHDEAYARGGHIMYVDINQGEKLVDYSRNQKYFYRDGAIMPSLNNPALPPSDTSGVSAQFNSILIMGINPWNPRYMWTKTDPEDAHQLWDLIEDTTFAFKGGTGDQREFAVSKDGSLYYFQSTTAVKRTPDGGFKIAGRTTARYGGNCFTYSHSYDSAFSITHGYGEVILWDFVNDTVRQIGDMPGDRSNALYYRAVAVSRDGKNLYTLGDGGNIYEFEIATGSYKVIGNISGQLSGYVMASGGSLIDTLGNWYFAVHNNNLNPLDPFIMRVHLGKDLVKPLHIPTPEEIAVEQNNTITDADHPLRVHPNPFNARIRIAVSYQSRPGGTVSTVQFSIFDINGKQIKRLNADSRQLTAGITWKPAGLPNGVYILKMMFENKVFIKKLILQW
jgi:hypothetical protein